MYHQKYPSGVEMRDAIISHISFILKSRKEKDPRTLEEIIRQRGKRRK